MSMIFAMRKVSTNVYTSTAADTDELPPELAESAAVEETVAAEAVHGVLAEEADRQSAEDSTDEVNRDDVERVVEAELELERDGERADHTSGCTNPIAPIGVT